MRMNIHPLFVHFPISLLVLYSILEVAAYSLPALAYREWVSTVKSFLIFVGILSAFAALVTGEIAEDLLEETGSRAVLIETHMAFAVAATAAYLIIAAAYLVRLFDQKGWWNPIVGTNRFFGLIWGFKKYVAHLILDTWFLPFLALLALVLITITGALGASIVYGPGIDPFVSSIYHLFFVQ